MAAAYRRRGGPPPPDGPATVIERKVERRTPAGRLISATKCKTVYFGDDPAIIDAIVASQSHVGGAKDKENVKKISPPPTRRSNADDELSITEKWDANPSIPFYQRGTADGWDDAADVRRRRYDGDAAVVVDFHSRVKMPTHIVASTPMTMPPPYRRPSPVDGMLPRKSEEPIIYNYKWEPRRIAPLQDHSTPSTTDPLTRCRPSKASPPLRKYYAAPVPVLSTDDEQSSGSGGTSRVKQSRLVVVRRSVCECKMADSDVAVEESLIREINACRQRVYRMPPLRVDAALNAAACSLAAQIALREPLRQPPDGSDLVDAFNVWTGRQGRLSEAAKIVDEWRREMDDQAQENYRMHHVYGDVNRIRKSAHNFERTDLRRVGAALCRVASDETEEENALTVAVVVYEPLLGTFSAANRTPESTKIWGSSPEAEMPALIVTRFASDGMWLKTIGRKIKF